MTNAQTRAGHFFAGTIGLAILRGWYEADNGNEDRLSELRALIETFDDFPHSIELAPSERAPLDGYAEWAASYDSPNPMVDAESAAVIPILENFVGEGIVALDAGCGTGRHAAYFQSRGCSTIGVDQSLEMLEVATSEAPDVQFLEGHFEALPLEDASVDIAVASLALCHLPDPTAAVIELARVLRPGGNLVISDPHPVGGITGGQAFYGGLRPGQPMPFVRNHHHLTSTWIRAFRAAQLAIEDCIEVPVDDELVKANPSSLFFADATRSAIHGLPYLFVWHLKKV